MSSKTSIEWTEATWNPIRARLLANTARVGWHCEHASPGCSNCYAETLNRAGRSTHTGTRLPYKPGHRKDVEVFADEKTLQKPINWRQGRKIFVCSMTDLFADFVTDDMIDQVFAVMAIAGQHTFQVLTKRPKRMQQYLASSEVVRRIMTAARELVRQTAPDPERRCKAFHAWHAQHGRMTAWTTLGGAASDMFLRREPNRAHPSWVTWPLPNVWVGTSIEDNIRLHQRAYDLITTPAVKRFWSAEPLLGPLVPPKEWLPDWVIVGGESGPGARPMHPDWARSLRDQCAAAGVPFLFKQWGNWAPGEIAGEHLNPEKSARGMSRVFSHWQERWSEPHGHCDDEPDVYHIGKKRAGRVLDGVTHDGYPS